MRAFPFRKRACALGACVFLYVRLEIEEDAAGDVLASTSLGEEGVESIITATNGLVRGHLTIGLDTVLEAEKLPAGVTNLDTGLTDVDGNDFSHWVKSFVR